MSSIPQIVFRAVTFTVLCISTANAAEPPSSWVDKDTGHRITRLTSEAGSSGFYFNVNAYTPDSKLMAYSAPDGVHTLDLATGKTRLLVPNPPDANGTTAPRGGIRTIVVGKKTNSIFYSKTDATSRKTTVFKADMVTGQITRLVELPLRASLASINADETLGAGTYDETEAGSAQEYGRTAATPAAKGRPQAGNLIQAEDKQQMMERRLAAKIPIVLYTINLQSGKVTELLHSTDWIGHMLFSPVDPALLMYCHEGPWHKVDRIWMIHTDGTQNRLVHKRTMAMEIAGHEFWGLEGETIWFDWQYPKREDFFIAGYNLQTGQRTAFHLQRNEWSIHFNLTQGETLFTGDGGDSGQVARAHDGAWIELFRPEKTEIVGINNPGFIQPGIFHSEHLVNMSHHNYRLEPNVRFTPDKKMVLFTSNMFGPSYIFGVEVEKAVGIKQSDLISTPELAKHFNPIDPTPTPDDK